MKAILKFTKKLNDHLSFFFQEIDDYLLTAFKYSYQLIIMGSLLNLFVEKLRFNKISGISALSFYSYTSLTDIAFLLTLPITCALLSKKIGGKNSFVPGLLLGFNFATYSGVGIFGVILLGIMSGISSKLFNKTLNIRHINALVPTIITPFLTIITVNFIFELFITDFFTLYYTKFISLLKIYDFKILTLYVFLIIPIISFSLGRTAYILLMLLNIDLIKYEILELNTLFYAVLFTTIMSNLIFGFFQNRKTLENFDVYSSFSIITLLGIADNTLRFLPFKIWEVFSTTFFNTLFLGYFFTQKKLVNQVPIGGILSFFTSSDWITYLLLLCVSTILSFILLTTLTFFINITGSFLDSRRERI